MLLGCDAASSAEPAPAGDVVEGAADAPGSPSPAEAKPSDREAGGADPDHEEGGATIADAAVHDPALENRGSDAQLEDAEDAVEAGESEDRAGRIGSAVSSLSGALLPPDVDAEATKSKLAELARAAEQSSTPETGSASRDEPKPPKATPETTRLGEVARADLEGKFGFDWHSPRSKCTRLTSKIIDELAKAGATCTSSREPPFGEGDPKFATLTVHRCPTPRAGRSRSKEWLVFPSKPACVDQWEIMDANGP
jgi:hypothetical protein